MSLHEVQTGSGRLSGKVAIVTGESAAVGFSDTDELQVLPLGLVELLHADSSLREQRLSPPI